MLYKGIIGNCMTNCMTNLLCGIVIQGARREPPVRGGLRPRLPCPTNTGESALRGAAWVRVEAVEGCGFRIKPKL